MGEMRDILELVGSEATLGAAAVFVLANCLNRQGLLDQVAKDTLAGLLDEFERMAGDLEGAQGLIPACRSAIA